MILTTENFLALVSEIKQHGYELAIAENSDPQFYTCDKELIVIHLEQALEKRFPGMESDEIEASYLALIRILEGPIIMFKYIENKFERDHVLQKVLSPDALALLKSSITRSQNIAYILPGLEMLPEEFPEFTNSIKQLYSSQAKSSDDDQKIQTAKKVRELVYKFCLGILGLYPLA